ncbi:hypothetical protein BDA96_06G136300 [Sorghum bicolor]|uniref:Uncharacterized protein n=1 Tax=Sorghum bicolor TaxID=4558 RepID=A0A921QQS1_SORBI|nr:hypothetical protein BDA96_06G136300 [Sorghum bicolor]
MRIRLIDDLGELTTAEAINSLLATPVSTSRLRPHPHRLPHTKTWRQRQICRLRRWQIHWI